MEKIKKFLNKYWIVTLIVVIGFIIDRITKIIAINNLKPIGQKEIIRGLFSFTYTQNTGGGWGMFSGHMWLFYIVTIIAIGVFIYFMKETNMKEKPLFSIGLALMFAGCLGNFYDRIFQGYVVDFLDMYIFGYDFPIFNFADMCLTCGAGIIIIYLLIHMNDADQPKKEVANNNIDNTSENSTKGDLDNKINTDTTNKENEK
ncbi:MAG: signal peptidase II [Bacilli bacterium]